MVPEGASAPAGVLPAGPSQVRMRAEGAKRLIGQQSRACSGIAAKIHRLFESFRNDAPHKQLAQGESATRLKFKRHDKDTIGAGGQHGRKLWHEIQRSSPSKAASA